MLIYYRVDNMGIKATPRFLMSLFLVMILILNLGSVSAAQWEVGVGQTYENIQLAIDDAKTIDGDVINVHSGIYSEDVRLNKKLTLQANTGDDVRLQPVNTGFTVVSEGSGSTIDGFSIDNSPQGTGINISADNCTLKNNQINGGTTGIAVSGANTSLTNNVISGQSSTGILGNLTGGFFTVTGNIISNITGTGTLAGITVSTNGSLSLINIKGNTISHFNAMEALSSVFAVQLGKSRDASGNPELANVTDLIVTNNVITDITATSAIMGMELITTSVNTLISENKISQLKGIINSSVYSLEAAIMGNGTVLVSKNQVSEISANEQAVGILTVALGDLIVEDNQVSSINDAGAVVGILGLGLMNNATFENNKVLNFNSPSIAAGIVGTAMAHLKMLYNTVIRVNGANDVSMVSAGFNSTSILGNNLEGDGNGNGIVVCSPNGTINYNRIVNYEYFIQNFKFSSFGPDIDEMLKPIDDAIKKHPELEPILKPIRDDLDRLFHELENSKTSAIHNWYGTNLPDSNKFFVGNGTLNYNPWLVLTLTAHPSTIYTGQNSLLTADVYTDVAGGDHRADAAMFFSGPQVTFTTTLGNVGSKFVTVPWIKGLANTILRADEGQGIATVTAADYEMVRIHVTILDGSPTPPRANAQSIGMQKTGINISGIVLAILMILGGLFKTRK